MPHTTRRGQSARADGLAHAIGLLCCAGLIACGETPDISVPNSGTYVPPPVVPPAGTPAVPTPPAEPYDPLVSSPFIVDSGATPGGRLAFMYYNVPVVGAVRIYSMLTDGTELTPVTPDDVDAWSPRWSPDDALIAYATDKPGGGSLIWVVRPDGSGIRQVTEGDYPFWLADGRIGYSCNDTDICAVDPGGASVDVLLRRNSGLPEYGYTISPDGAMIAFVRIVTNASNVYTEPNPYNIWVMRRDGTGLRRLTSTDSATTIEFDPSWSRDGSQIAFRSNRYGIAVADADGGRLHSISHEGDIRPSIGRGSPAWSPDGSKIIFGGELGTFFIANADGSGLIRRVTVPMPAGYGVGSWSWSQR